LYDPVGVLSEIYRILRPGGKVFVEVQNFPEYFKISRAPYQLDHLYYFCPETLEAMLLKTRLLPIKIDVDTVTRAQAVSNFMWNRSASIHIRVLAEKTDAVLSPKQFDYRKLKDQMASQLHSNPSLYSSFRNYFSTLLKKFRNGSNDFSA
jgi:hypothetical protein